LDLDELYSDLPYRYRIEWDKIAAALLQQTTFETARKQPNRESRPCRLCGCSRQFDVKSDRVCLCDSCRDFGCNSGCSVLKAFKVCRPDETTSHVPGYNLPLFFANNFAKGWQRPDISGKISSPLTPRLSEDTTMLVAGNLDAVSVASLRASCRALDIFVRHRLGFVLEEAFVECIDRHLSPCDDVDYPQRNYFDTSFGSDDEGFGRRDYLYSY
jgi:hypothetical protein